MEHEKCLEILFHCNTQIEPTLLNKHLYLYAHADARKLSHVLFSGIFDVIDVIAVPVLIFNITQRKSVVIESSSH